MDLVLKLNDQLKETKKELDALIQSKQSDSTSKDVIPTISIVVPSTLAPTAPPTTTLPVTEEYTTTTGAQGEKATKLIKGMEEKSIQAKR